MGGDVKAHAELEPKGRFRVEHSEVHQQAHGGAAVRQHVQHGAKAGAWEEQHTLEWQGRCKPMGGSYAYSRDCSHTSPATHQSFNAYIVACYVLDRQVTGTGGCASAVRP